LFWGAGVYVGGLKIKFLKSVTKSNKNRYIIINTLTGKSLIKIENHPPEKKQNPHNPHKY
jgi:ABC-type Zn uptake system ZnuABC Zn-binding protein ZnuA